MNRNRKYFMTPACQSSGSVIIEQEYTVRLPDENNKAENQLRVSACPKNENNDGWLQMTATKYGDKRSTSVYVCLSRQQAIALRDLLNAAYGGSSREARRIEGSVFIASEKEVA